MRPEELTEEIGAARCLDASDAAMPEPAGKVVLYANVGPELAHYDIDVAGANLTRRASINLPANVQYAWPHASRPFFYVATSNSASGMGPAGEVGRAGTG